MTWDRWLALLYFLWLLFTAFALGILVGRQWMRNKVNKALDEVQRILDARAARGK